MTASPPWPTRPLKACGALLTGGTPSRAESRYWGGVVPWISAKSLKSFDVTDSEDRLTEAGASVGTLVPPGSILFVVRGMSLANEFRVGVAGREVCFNQDLRAMIPCRDIDGRYLARFLQAESSRVLTLVDEASHGTKRLTSERFESIEVPMPSLVDQRRIAEMLDSAETLRAKRRDALAQLDILTQAIFLEMFGNPTTNPKRWPAVRLRDCTNRIQIGPFGSLLHQNDYIANGISLINPKHIQDGSLFPTAVESVTPQKHAQLKTYHLHTGDVVMGRRGEMGRCAIVRAEHDGLLCGTGSLFIRPNEQRATAAFLSALLSTKAIKERLERLSLGATLPNLNSGIVEELVVGIPPIELQHEYARRMSALERLTSMHRTCIEELNALFASLQHRAFRGEL